MINPRSTASAPNDDARIVSSALATRVAARKSALPSQAPRAPAKNVASNASSDVSGRLSSQHALASVTPAVNVASLDGALSSVKTAYSARNTGSSVVASSRPCDVVIAYANAALSANTSTSFGDARTPARASTTANSNPRASAAASARLGIASTTARSNAPLGLVAKQLASAPSAPSASLDVLLRPAATIASSLTIPMKMSNASARCSDDHFPSSLCINRRARRSVGSKSAPTASPAIARASASAPASRIAALVDAHNARMRRS
mmetsp:Transcript_1053/g.4458  ORF Transcript_1053/g.4458 Transcript_1053/m.4458 type:complete len:264 (-) Transcript_1053:232-1023(-)